MPEKRKHGHRAKSYPEYTMTFKPKRKTRPNKPKSVPIVVDGITYRLGYQKSLCFGRFYDGKAKECKHCKHIKPCMKQKNKRE